ncbi:MAG TPA: GNAT family N-acetyltransferase [Stellaceae bacterium]|jgi:ribosomal-protein-alanine N-acetyltransferase
MTLAVRTPRLLLRQWRDEDAEPFAAMSADPEVTALLLGPFDRAKSDEWVALARDFWRANGYGQWVVEVPGEAKFAGVVGLTRILWEAPFTPVVEAAWRLARPYWGRGIAFEAARAAIEDGFSRLRLEEIVAITTPPNERSWRLMERLGMVRDTAGDFDHPRVPDGHPLKRHVLYRLKGARASRPHP